MYSESKTIYLFDNSYILFQKNVFFDKNHLICFVTKTTKKANSLNTNYWLFCGNKETRRTIYSMSHRQKLSPCVHL